MIEDERDVAHYPNQIPQIFRAGFERVDFVMFSGQKKGGLHITIDSEFDNTLETNLMIRLIRIG